MAKLVSVKGNPVKLKDIKLLVDFNPPAQATYKRFETYREKLDSYYNMNLSIGRSREVIIGYLYETKAVNIMMGFKSFSTPLDGLEIYLYKPAAVARCSLASVHEVTPGTFHTVIQPLGDSITKRYEFIPTVLNSLIFNPLMPQYKLEYNAEILLPFRLVINNRDWVPLKITKGERVAVNDPMHVWDNEFLPVRVSGSVPNESRRWNINYVGSKNAKHDRARVSPLCDVTVSTTVATREQSFNPDDEVYSL